VLKVTLYTSLRHRIAVLACAGLLMIAGVLLGRTLDIDVLPDINRPSLTIMVESQGLATEEVESLVTRPLELSLAGMPGVTRMRTTSDVGLSIVTLDLAWGADLVTARQQAAERLGAAASQLPAGIVPQIQPISSIMGEIMLVALTAEHNSSPRDLRTLADWVVRPRLLSVPGVAQVTVIGGEVRQFRTAPRLAMLAGLNISLADLERAAARFGVNAGGGLVADAGTEFTIRAVAARTDAAALAKTVVAVRDGVPVLLSQLAEVDEAAKPSRGSAGFDGQDAVILSVQKQPKADTRAVTALVSDAIKDMQSSLSDRTRIHVAFQQADFINSGLTNVRDALIAAIAIVAVVLFVFLGNVRATFISLLAIPLSVLVAILSLASKTSSAACVKTEHPRSRGALSRSCSERRKKSARVFSTRPSSSCLCSRRCSCSRVSKAGCFPRSPFPTWSRSRRAWRLRSPLRPFSACSCCRRAAALRVVRH